jgi:hypothetical protein
LCKDNGPGYKILSEVQREPNVQLCTTNKCFHQGCGLGLYLFNVLINDIIGCIGMDGTHYPVVNGLKTQRILLACELTVFRATGRSLVKSSPIARGCVCFLECDQMQKYCSAFTRVGIRRQNTKEE